MAPVYPEAVKVDDATDGRLAALEALVAEQSILIEKLSSAEKNAALSAEKNAASSAENAASSSDKTAASSADTMRLTTSGSGSACAALLHLSFSPANAEDVNGIQFALMALLANPSGQVRWRKRLPGLSIMLGFLPFGICVLQFMLLVLVTEAGTSSACNAETQQGCHLGEYCSLAFANGQCNDCSLVLDGHFGPPLAAYCPTVGYDFYNSSHPLAFTHPLTNITYSGSCKMFGACTIGAHKDTNINRCDFLVAARADIKVHQFLITIIGAVLACYPLMADMDESDTDLACYLRARHIAASQLGASVQRSMKMLVFTCRTPADGGLERLLYILFHASSFLRKMLLPSLVASTTVVILVAASGAASFDAVNTFLNVIAVGFICELDNILGRIFVHSDMTPRHEALLSSLDASDVFAIRRPVRWLQNRIHALLIGISLACEALYMEQLILALNPVFGGFFLGIGDKGSFPRRAYERVGPEHYGDANCNKIIFAIHAMTLYRALLGNVLTFVFDVVHTVGVHRGRPNVIRRHLIDHVLSLLGGGTAVYIVFRAGIVPVMETLRMSPRFFS